MLRSSRSGGGCYYLWGYWFADLSFVEGVDHIIEGAADFGPTEAIDSSPIKAVNSRPTKVVDSRPTKAIDSEAANFELVEVVSFEPMAAIGLGAMVASGFGPVVVVGPVPVVVVDFELDSSQLNSTSRFVGPKNQTSDQLQLCWAGDHQHAFELEATPKLVDFVAYGRVLGALIL
ncbi:hypothetical protein F0562_017963 [Nyssa sinensis]|uniref:Uncharacterized protein n=1 Tax=Nyssa sinensis TaxID=561372 RepID=A0A5J4ZAP6_9ASTE|nr:hypothetical protein F0562_017963 [Nyssa sinensis]